MDSVISIQVYLLIGDTGVSDNKPTLPEYKCPNTTIDSLSHPLQRYRGTGTMPVTPGQNITPYHFNTRDQGPNAEKVTLYLGD